MTVDASAVLRSLGEAVIALDADCRITFSNEAAQTALGRTEDDMNGRDLRDIALRMAESNGARHASALLDTIDVGCVVRDETDRFQRSDGTTFAVAYTASPLVDADRPRGAVLVFMDITDRQRLEGQRQAQLLRLEVTARTDELTGLPNRLGWNQALHQELARVRRNKHPLGVVLIDLDDFKKFNDDKGHLAGDELLREAAREWQRLLRVCDTVARFGGDEFAVALPDCPSDEGSEVLARLSAATPGGVTCSAGLAYWAPDETSESLVTRADDALYAAKRSGGGRTVLALEAI